MSNKKLKISIVTISYNQAQFLEKAILSVIEQDYSNIEYIVVDPGSTDGSREIIEKYRNRIDKVIYEKDSGAADGLNKGFSHATGDVFAFLNSDDELLPGSLSRVASFFRNNLNIDIDIDIVAGCGYFIDSEGVLLKKIVPSRLTPWFYIYGAVSLFQQGTFFREKYYHQVGGFNTENYTCWDGELFLEMVQAGAKFKTIGYDLAYFRLHEAGISGSGRLESKFKEDMLRLFIKVIGREKRYYDYVLIIIAKMLKGIYDPFYYFRKISLIKFRTDNEK